MLNRLISSILKVFFNLLYHQFSWAYDWVADIVSIGRWKTWIYTVIPHLGDNDVLELGCGPGHLQHAYSPGGSVIFGLDSSRQMLQKAKRNLSEHDRTGNLILGIAQDLPFRDNSFPVIVATFPSNYIYELSTLNQTWRVLQVGGQLIILPAVWITGSSILDRLAFWIFTITGESPRFDANNFESQFSVPFERLSAVGFHVHHEIIKCEGSEVLLIIAVKHQNGV